MRITNGRNPVSQMLLVKSYFFGWFAVNNSAGRKNQKESRSCLLNNLGFRVPVLAGKQELRSHVQGTLRTNVIAL